MGKGDSDPSDGTRLFRNETESLIRSCCGNKQLGRQCSQQSMTALMHTYTGGQDPHPTTPVTQHRDSIPQARLGDPKMEGGTGEKTYVKPSLAAEVDSGGRNAWLRTGLVQVYSIYLFGIYLHLRGQRFQIPRTLSFS